VSRAFNEGLGQNFNAVINGFRVDAVKERLRRGDADILAAALDAGFASKASFNRAFRQHTGVSPTQWRASQILKPAENTGSEATDASGPP
jgi:AraC-like DNA-binding protein